MLRLVLLSFSLIALAWLLSKRHVKEGPPLVNYDGVVYYDPLNVLTPTSLLEIQKVIRTARKEGRVIRALGSGHSWSRHSMSDDLYLSLDGYRGLVSMDRDQRLATFRGGTKLWEINQVLDQHGLALSLLPSISNQTIAGAIATGTHHTGVDFGIMATFVTEIEIVTGTGEVMSVTPSDKLFHAVGVSVGLLGVITEVTIKCEDSFNLEETRTTPQHTLSHCLHDMANIATSAEHVKLWIEINSGVCAVYTANRTTEQTRNPIPQPSTDILFYFYEVLTWVWSVLPFTAVKGMTLLSITMDVFPNYNRVGRNWEVFNIPHYIAVHKEAEISVLRDKCSDAIKALIEVKEKFKIPVNFIVEVRFVKRDEFWLSNNYQRDACHITQMMYNPSDHYWTLYAREFFKATLKYGGRPHWGKDYYMEKGEVEQLYPRLKEFLEIRSTLDPDGVFVTRHIADLFGI